MLLPLPLLVTNFCLAALAEVATPAESCPAGGCGGLDIPSYSFDLTDPNADYNSMGIERFDAKDFAQAEVYFKAGVLQAPARGDVWSNLGQLLLEQAKAALKAEISAKKPPSKRSANRLAEAAAACDVGTLLGWTAGRETASAVQRTFAAAYPQRRCASTRDCVAHRREAKALTLQGKGDHIAAARLLCSKPRRLTISLRAGERETGLLTAETMRRMLIVLRVCGVLAITNVIAVETVDRVAAAQQVGLDAWLGDIGAAQPPGTTGTTGGEAPAGPPALPTTAQGWEAFRARTGREWVSGASRGPGRYETKYPMASPYTDPGFMANRFVLQVVQSQLGRRVEVDTFSAVTSFPGAPEQRWHADVDPLFVRKLQGGVEKNPPFGLVALMPLVEIEPAMGPTEFYVGSHANLPPGDRFHTDPGLTHHITPKVGRGGVVLFDMRVRHRGGSNRSDQPRPISYVSYVRDWYHDQANFKSPHTARYDTLPDARHKKLLSRVDSQAYVRQLEDIVRATHPHQMAALQSAGGYKQADLVV